MNIEKNYIPFMGNLSECIDSLMARDMLEMENLSTSATKKASFISTTYNKISDLILQKCFKFHNNSTAYLRTFNGTISTVDSVEYLEELSYKDTSYHQRFNHHNVQREKMIWFINPLSGLINYEHNNEHVCFSMALCNSKNEGLCSMIYMPYNGMFIYAQKNKGCYIKQVNNTFIRGKISPNNLSDKLIISLNKAALSTFAKNKSLSCHAMYMLGCTPLEIALAAIGNVDLAMHHNVHLVDIMPSTIMIAETGGILNKTPSTPHNKDHFNIIAGNKKLLTQLNTLQS